jgi:hypothetical protein
MPLEQLMSFNGDESEELVSLSYDFLGSSVRKLPSIISLPDTFQPLPCLMPRRIALPCTFPGIGCLLCGNPNHVLLFLKAPVTF